MKALKLFLLKRKKAPKTRILTKVQFDGTVIHAPQYLKDWKWQYLFTGQNYKSFGIRFEIQSYQDLLGMTLEEYVEKPQGWTEEQCEIIIDAFLNGWYEAKRKGLKKYIVQETVRKYP